MKFTPVSTPDIPWLWPYFQGQTHELCEYSLPGILAWSGPLFYPCAAEDQGRLILGAEYPGHPDYRHLLLPLGGAEAGPEELARLIREADYPSFWFVPEAYLERHGREEVERWFVIEEQPGYHDYVYRVEDLAGLKGNRYAKKRNLIKQFEREHPQGRLAFEAIGELNRRPCAAFLDEWCEQEGCFRQGDINLECEMEAALNMLGLVGELGARGLALRIDGVISALAVASPLTREMATLQFQKACKTVKGLYQFFDRECARRLCAGYIWVNKESDMGREGLAHAKRSYHPARMVRSFALRRVG